MKIVTKPSFADELLKAIREAEKKGIVDYIELTTEEYGKLGSSCKVICIDSKPTIEIDFYGYLIKIKD